MACANASLVDERPAQGFERVDAELADPLTLEDDPVLVPGRQQVELEEPQRGPGHGRPVGPAVDEVAGTPLAQREVDLDLVVELHDVAGRVHEAMTRLAHPPERVAQVGLGPFLPGLGPQASRECFPALAGSHDRQAAEDPLRLGGERDGPTGHSQLEATEQAKLRHRR